MAWYLNTNYFANNQVRIIITLSVSEKLDFSVGSNMVEYVSIKSGITNYAIFTNETYMDGSYVYMADIGWVDADSLSNGTLFLISCYKDRGLWRLLDCVDIYTKWQEAEAFRILNAKRIAEENSKRGGLDFYQYRDSLDDRYKALVKNYEVKFNGAMGGYSIWSKKLAPRTATRFDVALRMKADSDMSFWRDSGHENHNVVSGIQFQLIIPQISSYFVDMGAIYTADGGYLIQYPFSFENGEMLTEHDMSKASYAFEVVMTPRVVKESGKLEYLNKMFNSGKPIYIEFRGQVIGSMKYQLTAQDIARVKDLLKFINELQGGF